MATAIAMPYGLWHVGNHLGIKIMARPFPHQDSFRLMLQLLSEDVYPVWYNLLAKLLSQPSRM